LGMKTAVPFYHNVVLEAPFAPGGYEVQDAMNQLH
jgi:hypothetical protein